MQDTNEVKLKDLLAMVNREPEAAKEAMSKEPEVVLLAIEDWANAAYNFAKALRSVGVNAIALSKKPVTWWDDQAIIYYKADFELYPYCAKAKWIIWMHSQYTPLPDAIMNNRSIKFAVFHGGTQYRTMSEQMNNLFNPRVDLCLIQTLEMWNLGAKEPKFQLIPPVDTDYISFAPKSLSNDIAVVAHFPRHPQVKGSVEICRAVEELMKERGDFEYVYSEEQVSWEDNLMRIMDCDIYIEQLGTGYWSITAMEAAALGKVVIASFDHQEIYKEQYGLFAHGITVAQNAVHLKEVIAEVFDSNLGLLEQQKIAREWVADNHSYITTGSRLKRLLNI